MRNKKRVGGGEQLSGVLTTRVSLKYARVYTIREMRSLYILYISRVGFSRWRCVVLKTSPAGSVGGLERWGGGGVDFDNTSLLEPPSPPPPPPSIRAQSG